MHPTNTHAFPGKLLLVAALLCLFLAACKPETAAQPAANQGPAAATASQRHEIRGVVVDVPAEGKLVTVDHEDIPGVMHAMKMELTVPDAEDRARMKPGARFRATLVVENSAMWIEKVEITGQGEVPAEKAADPHAGHSH